MTGYQSVENAFTATANSYEGERRILIPCFDAYYGNAIEIVVDAVAGIDSPRILDLGAGTGLLSALLGQFLHAASFHLVDLSPAMLERARERLDGAGEHRFTAEVADLTSFEPIGTWNAVVSGLAIHHLPDEEKRSLYARVFEWLEPGGVFVNVEQVLGPTSELEERYERVWQEQVISNGGTPEMIERTKTRMAFDQCAPMETQLAWLRASGYGEVDCTFKSWRFAVLSAWK